MSVSELDFQQIIQRVYDPVADRLKVDADLTGSTISPPGLEVAINAVDDNIAIRNSTNSNELLINSDGSINVSTTISGTSNINLEMVSGTNTSVGNGIADAGSQRVVIAQDNTPFPVNAVQSGGWAVTLGSGGNVIGEVIQHQGVNYPWGITGTVTADIGTTGGLALDSSLSTINTTLGSPFQVGGSIGNTSFIATQSTASNLNATVVGTGTFATQASQSGTWNINDISGTISLPTGAATESTLTSILNLETTKEKILAANDLVESFTWSDFGTSTQRVATIVKASTTVGHTATGTASYTFVAGKYRLDNITWSLV